jgi:hypothetical protein
MTDLDLNTLFARARENRPDTSKGEYAFETRLLARLRSDPEADTGSIWAIVSWRAIPFLAAGVVALTIWQSRVVTESDDTAALAGLENPTAVDLWSSFN